MRKNKQQKVTGGITSYMQYSYHMILYFVPTTSGLLLLVVLVLPLYFVRPRTGYECCCTAAVRTVQCTADPFIRPKKGHLTAVRIFKSPGLEGRHKSDKHSDKILADRRGSQPSVFIFQSEEMSYSYITLITSYNINLYMNEVMIRRDQ